jgi:GNAT superfamily N-acetyltransferase
MPPSENNACHLRPARSTEIDAIGALCLRSKAHWGYDQAFLEACRAELQVTPASVDAGLVQVAEIGGEIVGLAEIGREEGIWHLEKLFVEPRLIGKGIGRVLMEWAVDEARSRGAAELVIEADPQAAEFYRRFGARDAGMTKSGSIAGRTLPRLILTLRQEPAVSAR